MRFKKILLVYPRYPGSHYKGEKNPYPSIGLGIIGEMLRRCGVDYEVADMGLGYEINYLKHRIEEYQPEAVGISMMTFRYKYIYTVLEEIKKFQKDIKIIAGGPHITAWRTKVLEQCPAIDFGVCREGEFTITELCEGKDLSAIKGLIYKDGGDIVFTGERELIGDLDTIPFPKYEKFELDKYESTAQINSSRGCPYGCIFCQSCSVLGGKWRSRSEGNIADEVQYWHDKGYRNFNFVDDNFTMNKNLIYQLCEQIEARQLNNASFNAPGVRVDLVDRALLKRMREIGFVNLAFGIEAGNNRVLKTLKKGFTIERAEQTIRDAIELGFGVKLYFLVGSPYESLRDVRDSIEFALKYPVFDVNFASLMPIPETELMDWVVKEGRLLSPPEVYLNEFAEFERVPHFDAPGMTLDERKYALHITQKTIIKIRRRAREKEFRKRLAHLGVLGVLGAKLLRFEQISVLFNTKLFRPLKYILGTVFLNLNKKVINRPINVVHYKSTFPVLTENWLYNQINNLDKNAAKVYALERGDTADFPFENLRSLRNDLNPVSLFFNRAWYKLFKRYPHFFIWLWQDRPELLHAHFGVCGYDMLPYARWFKIPLVTSFYGCDAYQIPQIWPEWRDKYKKLFSQGRLFLAEGPAMGQKLIELGCSAEKVVVHHIGIKPENYRFKERKPDGQIRLLVCGRFVEKKGISYAVEALSMLRAKTSAKVHLTIAGDSDSKGTLTEEKRKILGTIEKYELCDSVTITGMVSHERFMEMVYDHHIYLAPSVHACDGNAEGGFPVVLTEVLATGMPVVAFGHCDIPYIVQDGKSGFIVPEHDTNALAEKLAYLIEHSQIWSQMGQHGRYFVMQHYDIHKLNNRLMEIYRNVLDNQS